MHYANETQLSALKELGFTPTETKTPLTEVAQWLWEGYKIELATNALKTGKVDAHINVIECGDWEVFDEQTFAIEKQKNNIVDQAAEIAEQRTQILAMIAQTESKNDNVSYFCWAWNY